MTSMSPLYHLSGGVDSGFSDTLGVLAAKRGFDNVKGPIPLFHPSRG